MIATTTETTLPGRSHGSGETYQITLDPDGVTTCRTVSTTRAPPR
jgi:hypothetical protein